MRQKTREGEWALGHAPGTKHGRMGCQDATQISRRRAITEVIHNPFEKAALSQTNIVEICRERDATEKERTGELLNEKKL